MDLQNEKCVMVIDEHLPLGIIEFPVLDLLLDLCRYFGQNQLCMSAAMTRTAHADRTLIFITLSLAR